MAKKHKVCTVPNCNLVYYARGCCRKHYNQIKEYGRLTPELEIVGITRRCSERNCNNLHYAIGLCEKHYHQKRIYGQVVSEVEDNEPCEVKDCPFQGEQRVL